MNDTRKTLPARRDPRAARLLFELREQSGLSPELVPHAMLAAGIDAQRIPSSRAIRRYEDEDIAQVPNVAYRAGLAEFYGRSMGAIWAPTRRRVIA